MKRCTKGKSCGATCITQSDRCVLELGPVVSESLTKVRSKLGVVKMYYKVRDQGVKGGQAKFERIRKDFANEIGGRIDKTKDLIELKKRVQKEGLLPKTKKSEKSDDFFKNLFVQEPKDKAPSVPPDLKAQLAALGAPRQLERSPGAQTKTPPAALKKGSTENMLDDISKILRGESPSFIQMASAPGFEGFKARFLGSSETQAGSATGNTRWARSDAKDFDMDLGKVRREGSKSYNGWEDSYASGARKIGEGAYGTVMKNPDGTFVKRGAISDTEAQILKRLGDIDLGPRLKAADINGAHPYQKENFVDIKNGRIAMSEVPGKEMGARAQADTKFGGKNAADIYWKAMADLHRQGIAHNDAHIDNIMIDRNGKGRWVDLGMAQLSPKAALAEALGIFPILKGGDDVTTSGGAKGEGNWQTKRWDGTGVKELQRARDKGGQTWTEYMQRFPVASRVWENKPDVVYELKRMGLDVNEINSMIYHGIRSPLDSYDKADGFGRITDQQAQKLLDILYDGI